VPEIPLRALKPKVHRQIIAKDISQCGIGYGVQAPEEVSVQLCNAIDQQGAGMALISQSTQNHRRQIATINW
jgi:hypothetical protein